jgi:large subunit ribosomal protein L24
MSKIKSRIKRDDTVVIIAGKHRGLRGRVLRVLPAEARVVVEGVNRVKRHQKPVGEQPGTIIFKEAPIHISNVALWLEDDNGGRRVKVGYQRLEDGRKVRVDRATGTVIDNG